MAQWKLPSTAGRPVCIIGAGVLGRRIAACWAAAGYMVHIGDIDSHQIDQALQYLQAVFSACHTTVNIEKIEVEGIQHLGLAVKDAWLVIECITEDTNLKIAIFTELERLAPLDTILATNSSSYKSRQIAAKVKRETCRRFLNLHYFVPPGIRIVDLMSSGSTHPEIFPFLQEHLRLSGMLPFVARQESTGLIINRV